jgi:hypothetical protein
MALVLISEHCYLPLFSERIQNSYWKWVLCNIILNTLFLLTIKNILVDIILVLKICFHTWFLYMEIKLNYNIVREKEPYDGRHPRIV